MAFYTDELDRAEELTRAVVDEGIAQAQRAVAAMPAGAPGECVHCGETSPRLVGGLCCRCRDVLGRP